MKRLLHVILIGIVSAVLVFNGSVVLTAQEKENYWRVNYDPFNDANVPFTDGLSMWIGRQKLTLKGYEVFLKADAPVDEGVATPQGNTSIELYLPLFYNENFSSMVGVQHGTSRILTDVRTMDMGLIHDWYWLTGSYQIDNWKFYLCAEYFANTNKGSLFSKRGEALMPYLVAGYATNDSWQLIGLFGYRTTSMVEDETTRPVIGVQMRYQPNQTFKLIMGAPVLLGSEWAVSQKFHFGCKAIFTGKFSSEAFVTFSPGENYYLGLHYNGTYNRSDGAYFNNETYLNGTEQIVYNNLTQYCHSIALDIGFKTSEEIAAVVSAGYRMGGNVSLYENKNLKTEIDGTDEFFVSVAVQYLKCFN